MTRRTTTDRPRKRPVQARSKQTVEWILDATTRVFRAEGFDATTNRIAAAAGVSIGTLYEYFPNKDALLLALAERHVALAEAGVTAALGSPRPLPEWLAALQAAIVASHRYPSQALALLANDERAPELRGRVADLRARLLAALFARASEAGSSEPKLRARTVFGLIAEQSSAAVFELEASERDAMLRHLLALACEHLRA